MAKVLRVPVQGLTAGEMLLDEAAARYVTRVHRLGAGAKLLLFDAAAGLEACAELLGERSPVRCRVAAVRPGSRPGYGNLCLFQGQSKGHKLEQVIKETTALGVGHIRPLVCARSIARPPADEDRLAAKLARWGQVAVDAARQCERSDLPQLARPADFTRAARDAEPGLHLLLAPHGDAPGLQHTLAAAYSPDRFVGVWIGPEGGFTSEESEQLIALGAISVSLGPWILRTETAATVAVALAAAAIAGPEPGRP